MKGQELSQETIERLRQAIETILTVEWGGPKNRLALTFYRQVLIPDLINCIRINLHVLNNETFIAAFSNKLNSKYGYPPSYAKDLGRDILAASQNCLAEGELLQQNLDPWEPWERIFRMLIIGETIPVIAQKTGFAEEYIEVLKKQYLHFSELLREKEKVEFKDLVKIPQLQEYGEQLLSFMYDLWTRINTYPYHVEHFFLEQLLSEIPLDVSLPHLRKVLRQVYFGRDVTWLLPGSASSVRTPPQLRDEIINKLVQAGWLVHNTSTGKFNVKPDLAKVIATLEAPNIVQYLLGLGEPEAAKPLFAKLPTYVLLRLIDELAMKQHPKAAVYLNMLMATNVKSVKIKVIEACGKWKHPRGVALLTEALTNKDALVRARACRVLGNLGEKGSYFAVVKCLQDPVPAVQEQALKALEQIGVAGAVKYIDALLEQSAMDYNLRTLARQVRSSLLTRNSR